MKPEPLTKEKIKRCIELMAVIQEEVGEAQKELNNIWFGKPEGDVEKLKEEVRQVISPLVELLELLGYSFELKERVEQLLKEIEKEIEKHKKKGKKANEEYDWRAREHELGIAYGLKFSKNLIKKAFSGVLEE